jgi:tetratricopeptide (TPR) repeat protein
MFNDISMIDSDNIDVLKSKITIVNEVMKNTDDTILVKEIDKNIDAVMSGISESDPSFKQTFKAYKLIILQQADNFEEIHDYRRAITNYNKLLDYNKFDVVILKKKAFALEKLEEFQQAKIIFELIIKLEDNEENQNHLNELRTMLKL